MWIWGFDTSALSFTWVYLFSSHLELRSPCCVGFFSFTMQCPNLWSRKTSLSQLYPQEHSNPKSSQPLVHYVHVLEDPWIELWMDRFFGKFWKHMTRCSCCKIRLTQFWVDACSSFWLCKKPVSQCNHVMIVNIMKLSMFDHDELGTHRKCNI